MFFRNRIASFPSLDCVHWILAIGLIVGFQRPAGAGTPPDLSTNPPPTTTTNTSPAESVPPALEPDSQGGTDDESVEDYNARLATARFMKKSNQPELAEPVLVSLLDEEVPEDIKKTALFELGATVRMENDLPRAQSIYSQFRDRWPNDPRVPEILLHEGQIFRQMGLNDLALVKFYAVMTAALSLKSDQPDYYPGLVLQAQTEIAETHYLSGRFKEAAEFYSRLIKLNDSALNRPLTQFRLIRSLIAIDRYEDAASQAQDFLSRYKDAPEEPEVRFHLAQALKKTGKNSDSLQQVLLLMQEEKAKSRKQPQVWAYWQQRAGNEIANQLYQEGDYVRALDVYVNLAHLDSAPAWQLPVQYQIGLTYERLLQPQKAVATYQDILKLEPELSTNATPGQQAVFEMARWRANFLGWQKTAEAANHSVARVYQASANPDTNFISTTSAP